MKSNIAKALLGAVTVISAAAVINKVLKDTNLSGVLKDVTKDITIDLDAFTPREEKVLNPNGEDLTVNAERKKIEAVPKDQSDLTTSFTNTSKKHVYQSTQNT